MVQAVAAIGIGKEERVCISNDKKQIQINRAQCATTLQQDVYRVGSSIAGPNISLFHLIYYLTDN